MKKYILGLLLALSAATSMAASGIPRDEFCNVLGATAAQVQGLKQQGMGVQELEIQLALVNVQLEVSGFSPEEVDEILTALRFAYAVDGSPAEIGERVTTSCLGK